jgi:hypothetical protein
MLRKSKAWLNIMRTAAADIEPVVFDVRSAIEPSRWGWEWRGTRTFEGAKCFFQPNDMRHMLPQRSAAIALQKSTN